MYVSLSIILILFSCNQDSKKPLEFIPLEMYNASSEAKNGSTSRSYYFIIRNYYPSDYNTQVIDSFVCANLDPEIRTLGSLTYFFYKESEKTNLVELQKNDRLLERYSREHDHVYTYYKSGNKKENEIFLKRRHFEKNDGDMIIDEDRICEQ